MVIGVSLLVYIFGLINKGENGLDREQGSAGPCPLRLLDDRRDRFDFRRPLRDDEHRRAGMCDDCGGDRPQHVPAARSGGCGPGTIEACVVFSWRL